MSISELKQRFIETFGTADEHLRIFFAPGRVNLIGEHTDYNGGFVLPCALQLGTFMLARKRKDRKLRMFSGNMEYREDLDINEGFRRKENRWTNYPKGIFDQFSKMGIMTGGFDLFFYGDIPDSAGLSSSASIEMVTAYGLTAMLNLTDLEMIDLVKLCKRSENEFVGVNCGIMDMFAVGMGSADHALFLNCHTLEYRRVPFLLNGYRMIIANTNKKRGLAGSKYNERVAECRMAVEALNKNFQVSKLGEIGFMQFFKMQDLIADETVRKRARHVISENQRVLNAVSCLHKGEILQFGALMNASHESLRDNYEVTGFELDTLVEEAWKVNGVIGARMTGAGFGGCTVNIVKESIAGKFIQDVGKAYEKKTGLKAAFYQAEASDGVREIQH